MVKDFKLKPSSVMLPIEIVPETKRIRTRKKARKTIHDIVLETAQRISKKEDQAVFSAKDLYIQALEKHPELNKKSFNAYVMSSAPEHTSWKHFRTKKEFLTYLGKGKYRLKTA